MLSQECQEPCGGSDMECPWGQFCSDLLVAASGSIVAVLGALWIAERTFKRDVDQERRDRTEERRQREREDQEADQESRQKILVAVLNECKLNRHAITLMGRDEAHQFPLRREALDQGLALIGSLPSDVTKEMQRLSLFVDRYNTLDRNLTSRFRLATLMEVNEPLVNLELRLSEQLGLPTRGQE
jgi:hypothetical protein